jgi:hypothetical protein
VKSFTLFVTDFPEFFWEKYPSVAPVDFHTHIASHTFLQSQQVLHGRFYPYLSQSFSRDPPSCAKGAGKFTPEEQEEN